MKKKIFVFIPHQDDEVNLIGNCSTFLKEYFDITVIFVCSEKNKSKRKIRRQEAIKSCSILGISKVLFLDFEDTSFDEPRHLFMTKEGKRRIIRKLERLLLEFEPEIVMCNDFDCHPDHRMLSIAMDEVIRELIFQKEYRPIYLKGFCYSTAYYGVEDYTVKGDNRTKISTEDAENLQYDWEKRISIGSSDLVLRINKRKAFKALSCHKSQYAILHSKSVINDDNVFWQIRTDNICINAKIYASSGDVTKLNDLKTIDTNDLLKKEYKEVSFEKSLWKPSEKEDLSEIRIVLKKETVYSIVIHGDPRIKKKYDVNVDIIIGDTEWQIRQLNGNSIGTEVIIDQSNVTEIKIKTNVGFSELEILPEKDQIINLPSYSWIKKKKGNLFLQLVEIFNLVYLNLVFFLTRVFRKIKKFKRKDDG